MCYKDVELTDINVYPLPSERNKPNNHETLIAEVGTVQLEFMMLSQLSGNPVYGQKVAIIDSLGWAYAYFFFH